MIVRVISTHIDPAMVVHTAAGRTTLDQVTDAMRAWYQNPQFDAEVPVLWDMRAAEFSAPDRDVNVWSEENLAEINAHRPGRKTAWVLADTAVTEFLVDVLSAHDFQHRVRVFHNDIDAARAWLRSTIR